MQVLIQVSADAVNALRHRSPPGKNYPLLLRRIESFGLSLEPLHAGTDDPALKSYFFVEVPDNVTAQMVIDDILHLEAVKAAYTKPPDELP